MHFFSRQAWHWFRCALSTTHLPVPAWHLKQSNFFSWNSVIYGPKVVSCFPAIELRHSRGSLYIFLDLKAEEVVTFTGIIFALSLGNKFGVAHRESGDGVKFDYFRCGGNSVIPSGDGRPKKATLLVTYPLLTLLISSNPGQLTCDSPMVTAIEFPLSRTRLRASSHDLTKKRK